MAPNTRNGSCSVCNSKVDKYEDYIKCVKCLINIHLKCADLTVEQYQQLNTSDTVKFWKCGRCLNPVPTVAGLESSCSAAVCRPGNGMNESEISGKQNTCESEVDHLRELLQHKEVIIKYQAQLIESLKEQLVFLKDLKHQTKTFEVQHTAAPIYEQTTEGGGSVVADISTARAVATSANQQQERPRTAKQASISRRINNGGATIDDKTEQRSELVSSVKMHEALTRAKCSEIINLAGKSDSQRNVHRPILGSKPTASQDRVRAARSCSYWHLYRLHPDTKAEDILDELKPEFPDVKVEQLKSRNPEVYASFKLTVTDSDKEEILKADRWPEGTRIRKFFLPGNR